MDIAKEPVKGDSVVEKDGFRVFFDLQASGMLAHATIDFNDMQGFVLNNMQPQGNSCGTCKC